MGITNSLRMILHSQRDLVRSLLGLSPHKIPIVGRPGRIAHLNAPDTYDSFRTLIPDTYVNEACARIIIRGDKYRPIAHARELRCPVLLQICDRDTLVPVDPVEETAAILGDRAEVKHYAFGPFDIYAGNGFDQGVRDQLAFFRKHLG